LNHKEPKIIDHIAFISVKHNVYLSELYNALLSAQETGKCECGNLTVEFRGTKNSKPVYLIKKADAVVAQFAVDKELLLRKDIHFDRWLDTDKIRKHVAKQKLSSGFMLIDNLRHGMKKVNLQAEVLEIEKPQLVHTQYGNSVLLTNALISDATGQVKLSLWGEQDNLAVGDIVQIKHASVSTFKGERHLSLGKMGTFTVLQNNDAELLQEQS
jgi:replication factor A1